MMKKAAVLCLLATALSVSLRAQERNVPRGVAHYDHIFLIMMENHGFEQVYQNPNEPYLNTLIASGKVNLATNYFAVGHPSLTNYLEIVGGSNFGVRADHNPNWGSTTCTPNISSGIVNADDYGGTPPVPIETGPICPISGTGMDAETPAIDTWNEVYTGVFDYLADLDGVISVPAEPVVGMSIGDQLFQAGLRWKAYEEGLPLGSVFGVNSSNGSVSNLTDFTDLAPLTSSSYVQLYGVKHNPFAFFASVQNGYAANNSLKNAVGFDGPRGLFADLSSGNIPNFSFIVPDQCDDQHGQGNGDAFCQYDPGLPPGDLTVGTQAGLNPGLIQQGDVSIQRIVQAIHASPAWYEGRNAIVVVWDENDYSGLLNAPGPSGFPRQNQNTVVLTVEVNRPGANGRQSSTFYTSFSLLKSLEAGFGLPCLNHACDPGVNVMSDLFGTH